MRAISCPRVAARAIERDRLSRITPRPRARSRRGGRAAPRTARSSSALWCASAKSTTCTAQRRPPRRARRPRRGRSRRPGRGARRTPLRSARRGPAAPRATTLWSARPPRRGAIRSLVSARRDGGGDSESSCAAARDPADERAEESSRPMMVTAIDERQADERERHADRVEDRQQARLRMWISSPSGGASVSLTAIRRCNRGRQERQPEDQQQMVEAIRPLRCGCCGACERLRQRSAKSTGRVRPPSRRTAARGREGEQVGARAARRSADALQAHRVARGTRRRARARRRRTTRRKHEHDRAAA